LTIICVCLRVIIIMTVIDDGPYTHTTILIDALFTWAMVKNMYPLISIAWYLVTVKNGPVARFLMSSVITALLLHVST
jgi:hypothetical protein